MTPKLLVSCPHCEVEGHRVFLGEILPNGDFAVLRRTHTTNISGDNFSVSCGSCGEVVYQRLRKEPIYGTLISYGFTRVLGEPPIPNAGTPGTTSI